MKKIEHVVLLMLENRSFDSMLGWLYESSSPRKHIPELKPRERVYEGLQGLDLSKYENVDSTGKIKFAPKRGAHGLGVPNVSPGENFRQVTTQLFNTPTPVPGAEPTMNGYVRDYADLMRKQKIPEADIARWAGQVMQSYLPYQIPVLTGLAQHYAVCDKWFSSVPSQTNTNRAFALCGTSMGLTDNGFLETDKRAADIEELVGYKLGDDRFNAKTIFNALEEDGKSTWKIFHKGGLLQNNISKLLDILEGKSLYQDELGKEEIAQLMTENALGALEGLTSWIDKLWLLLKALSPSSRAYLRELSSFDTVSDYTHRLFPELLKIRNLDDHFAQIDTFFAMAENGKLPHFTYIEPDWTISERGTGDALASILFHQGNDYHPPCNLDAGENLVKRVYQSLIRNKDAWEKTLLIITFDEPVGSFDHIPPPKAVPPWADGKAPAFPLQHGFKFDRYGGRVPAILVSPLVEKGTVFRSGTDTPFDHTSLISTVLKWRGLESKISEFGNRAIHAPCFDNVVSLTTPRTDARDIGFLQLERKRGTPVHYYDRFNLREVKGKYIRTAKEFAVMPFSLGGDDPAMSEYFPTVGYVDRYNGVDTTAFYFQNSGNRPDNGKLGHAAAAAKLVSTENGVGAYNVLGAWADSTDCYYFNDYLEGQNGDKQNWAITKLNGGGDICFGDQVQITNQSWKGQQLITDGDYITTHSNGGYWVIEPLSDEKPGPDCIQNGEEFYLKHAQSGRYVTHVDKGAQWYPTLGNGNRIKLKIRGNDISIRFICDGMPIEIVSTEELHASGGNCNVLMAYTNPYLYYYYDNYSPAYQSWAVSLVDASGLVKNGAKVRLVNLGYGHFLVPKDGYLTSTGDDSPDNIWVLERA